LLIDNASKQPLPDIWDISWHSRGRHIREDKLGLTHARLRGIQESGGGLLVFVDDDNLLALGFLERAAAISVQLPVLGCVWSGIIGTGVRGSAAAELRSNLNPLALRAYRQRSGQTTLATLSPNRGVPVYA
jgi:hypothetical protein